MLFLWVKIKLKYFVSEPFYEAAADRLLWPFVMAWGFGELRVDDLNSCKDT